MTTPQPSTLALDPAAAITRSQAEAVVAAYAQAMSRTDADGLAALFAPDATRIDPVGSAPNHGRDEIREAFRRALPDPPTRVRFEPGPVRGEGNVLAFAFEHTATLDGASQTLHGIDVFALTADGLIGSAAAYWGPDDWEPGDRARA